PISGSRKWTCTENCSRRRATTRGLFCRRIRHCPWCEGRRCVCCCTCSAATKPYVCCAQDSFVAAGDALLPFARGAGEVAALAAGGGLRALLKNNGRGKAVYGPLRLGTSSRSTSPVCLRKQGRSNLVYCDPVRRRRQLSAS